MMRSCPHCEENGIGCTFAAGSEHCQQCRAVPRRCEGSTRDEELFETEEELERIFDKLDELILKNAASDNFQRVQKALRSLDHISIGQHNEREKRRLSPARLQLKRELRNIREKSLPDSTEYQALLRQARDLQERVDNIHARWGIWLDELNELVGYPNYRGLPRPEELDEQQWKEAVEWECKYPGSSHEYPEPSPFVTRYEDEAFGKEDSTPPPGKSHEQSRETINAQFESLLRRFYPLFAVLISHKAAMMAPGFTAQDAVLVRDELSSIQGHAKLLLRQIALIREFIQQFALDGQTRTPDLFRPDSVQQHAQEISLQMFNLPSLLSGVADQNLIQHGTRDLSKCEVRSSLFGLSEMERFVRHVENAILVFPDLATVQGDGMDTF